jgi:oligopeptide/dipeptide ABC transporter ATP-binding protein
MSATPEVTPGSDGQRGDKPLADVGRPGGVTVAGVLLLLTAAWMIYLGLRELFTGEAGSSFGTLFDMPVIVEGIVYLAIGVLAGVAGPMVLQLNITGRGFGTTAGWLLVGLGVAALASGFEEGIEITGIVYIVVGATILWLLRSRALAFEPTAPAPRITSEARPASIGADVEPLIRLVGVKKYFPVTRGIIFQHTVGHVHAVDGIDLDVYPGETIGLVGETGCGKSTTARLITRLLDVTDGQIFFDGQDITKFTRGQMRELRSQMQMIFQDPYASLNPRKTVGSIIGEPFRVHGSLSKEKIKSEVEDLMELVGLNREHYNRFPHEFSGGQRQRIGVARALALHPRLIVCDEPVSALDVSIQAQILNLLEDLQEEFNLTYVFIAHDLSVVKHMSDRVAVMYLGRIVEIAPGDTLYRNPKHPYTGALLSAVPIPDPNLAAQRQRVILEGDVPSPIDPPSGCRFHPRCPRAQFPVCKEDDPALTPHHQGQMAACHFPLEDRAVVESTA